MTFINGAWVEDTDIAIILAIRAAHKVINHEGHDGELMSAYTLTKQTLADMNDEKRKELEGMRDHVNEMHGLTMQAYEAMQRGDLPEAIRIRKLVWEKHMAYGEANE